MHRIDGPGVAPGGLFTEGNPTTGTIATTVKADWCNAIQEELVNVVEAGGLALDKANNEQLLTAIRALLNAVRTPVGTVLSGYFATPPSGYLRLGGDLWNRAEYPDLWAHVSSIPGLVVSDAAWSAGEKGKFSSGNGATTFRAPDIRAYFDRALDDGAGIDDARTLGSLQGPSNQSHSHSGTALAAGSHSHGLPVQEGDDNGPPLYFGGAQNVDGTISLNTDAAGAHSHVLSIDSEGTEAKPRNVALYRVIKF